MCAECAKKASPSPMWRNIRNIYFVIFSKFFKDSKVLDFLLDI